MKTTIKHIIFLGTLVSSGLIAEDSKINEISDVNLDLNFENDPVLKSLNQSEKKQPKKESEKPKSSTSNLKEENQSDFPWLEKKSKLLQQSIRNAIEQGNVDELKKHFKGILEKSFDSKENIEMDQLLECWAQSIKLHKGPKTLLLFDEFAKHCKKEEIPMKSYFDENNINYIKSLALFAFSYKSFETFKTAYTIDKNVSDELISQLSKTKKHYCNPNYKKTWKNECNLVNQFEKTMSESSKK